MSDGISHEFGMLVQLRVNLPTDIFNSLHVLLISEDDARGKALAKALRDQRARVGDVQRTARDGSASRGADLILVDARVPLASEQVAKLRSDVRARWASLINVNFESVVKADGSVHLASLSELVAPLVQPDRVLFERAQKESNFSAKLAPLGPSRTLRALSLSGHTLFVELRHATLTASIELSNELLVSASAKRGDKRWDAWSALVRILGLEDAEVAVSRRSFTSAMNIMEPVDQALEVAAQERLCAAEQIAVEEAEAQPKPAAKLPPPPPPAALPVAARPSMPASPTLPAPPRQVPVAPPPPPAAYAAQRPAAGLGLNRTLLGVVTPALTPPAASAGAVEPKPSLSALATDPRPPAPESSPETPRYAHRSGATTGAKANMTLLGVAPGAIPGLAELRNQLAQAKPEPGASALADVVIQGKPDNSDFDPPTVKHALAELPDLRDDELPDLEDLPHSAAPLSQPLPPQRPVREESEGNNDSFEDAEDPEDQTTVAPSALTRELLEQAVQDALIERPSLDTFGARPIAATRQGIHSRDPGPREPSAPVVFEGEGEPEAEPAQEPTNEGNPEETLVVKRPPEPPPAAPKSTRLVIGLGLLLALAGLAWFASQRERQSAAEAPPEPTAVAAPAAQKPVEPAAPEPPPATAVAPAEPAPAPAEPTAPAAQAVEPGATPPKAAEPVAPVAPEPTPPTAPPAEPAAAPPSAPAAVAPSAADAPAADAPAPAQAPNAAAPAQGAEDPNALLRKGQRLAAQGDHAGARATLEQAMALAADNPHIREALALTLIKGGDLDAALAQAQYAVRLRPKRARYQVLVGDVLKAQGKPEEAQAAWQKALEIDANDAEAKQRLGVN